MIIYDSDKEGYRKQVKEMKTKKLIINISNKLHIDFFIENNIKHYSYYMLVELDKIIFNEIRKRKLKIINESNNSIRR